MSSKSCPKTCNQLTVAAILISIGVLQLLAGFILLKADDVYLLAGTDFIVASSNILIGSFLGITSSVWEKKKKVLSMKNTARQNVLAGLYIAALSMNATSAIIMILGNGSKLFTPPEDKETVSADFIHELLACAYVTSVCSPIICLVIALVCLSSNRIQIYENMKKKSITKTESFGWVFENNVENPRKNLSSVLQKTPSRYASVTDNVFIEKKTIGQKLFRSKPKKPHAKNSPPDSDPKSPLEIWAHKRKKILQEITSPKPMFFADDYLQFPDYKYDPYLGSMIPRVKQTSAQLNSHGSTPTLESTSTDTLKCKMAKSENAMLSKPSQTHLEELNLKLASRRTSYPSCNDEIDSQEDLTKSSENMFEMVKSTDELDNGTSQSAHSKLHRTAINSGDQIEDLSIDHQRRPNIFDSDEFESVSLISEESNKDSNVLQINEHGFKNTFHNVRRSSNDSVSSGLTSQTIWELKEKINRINSDKDKHKPEFLKSFKQNGKRKSYMSDSDVEDRSNFQKLHAEYDVFSPVSKTDTRTPLAGELIPIAIRPNSVNRSNSIPVSSIDSNLPNQYSVSVIDKASNQSLNLKSDEPKSLNSGDNTRFSWRTNSLFRSFREKFASISDIESNRVTPDSTEFSERKSNSVSRSSVMGSIAESPIEENPEGELSFPNPEAPCYKYSTSVTEPNADKESPMSALNRVRNSFSFSLKRSSSKAPPNTSPISLLNRLWSMKKSETKTDISTLIMDSDSLVGLSDEQLMDRTHRLRQLRKSVILRSKDEDTEDENLDEVVLATH